MPNANLKNKARSDFVPQDMKDFYKGLSSEEKEELKKAHDKHVDQEEVMAELKKSDPKLFEKTDKLWQAYKASINKLNPEAKEFAEEVGQHEKTKSKVKRINSILNSTPIKYIIIF